MAVVASMNENSPIEGWHFMLRERPLGIVGLVVVLPVVDETPEREVLRAVCRGAPDPRVGGPIADGTDERGDLFVVTDHPCRFADLVRTAVGTGRRFVHIRSIGRPWTTSMQVRGAG